MGGAEAPYLADELARILRFHPSVNDRLSQPPRSSTESPDPQPSDRDGAIYAARNLAADRFSFETELGSGERMRIALGPSGGVVGEVSSHDGTTIVDARTETHLTVDTFHWPLEGGPVSLRGPLAVERLLVALTFTSGASPTGRVVAPRARAGHLGIELPKAAGTIDVSHVELGEVRVTLDEERTKLVAGTVSLGRVRIPTKAGELRIDQAIVTGVEFESRRGEAAVVRLGAVEIDSAKLEMDGGYVVVHGLVLTGVTIGDDISIRASRVERGHVATAGLTPGDPAPPGRREVPIDLSFLDGLDGHIHADVSTHVRLPIVPDWRALHRLRLAVQQGRIEFERLEHGLSKLPDAVLDFNLRDGVLCLDKDIPMVPFDRTTLLSWPLSDEELRDAESGWVQLSRLFEPRVEIERKKRERDVGPKFLQQVRIHDIDIDLSLARDAVVALPGGVRLRLGEAVDADVPKGAAAVEEARISGEVLYRPDERRPPGTITIEADGLLLGIGGLTVADRELDVPKLRVGQLRSEVRMRDLSVERVYTDLDDIELTDLTVAA